MRIGPTLSFVMFVLATGQNEENMESFESTFHCGDLICDAAESDVCLETIIETIEHTNQTCIQDDSYWENCEALLCGYVSI